ncbi:hypothetical protein [Tepidibacter thalassicus]|uniref:Alkaline phosphatase-like protein n=1 Tax=Tepidibacter thalassicus DSM 15285 TaxID=1123350 RepID=A0A1M5Q0F0_9FIRM|nr:hypothetical protein [Tepidibacter thalassicus]SHH06953.1 hypothetical protein SAMN02744040_00691 [Tepidibacter thalassicus DSM 15285]
MKRKFLVMVLIVVTALNFISNISFSQNKGKVILININRTSISDLKEIDSLNKEMDKRGYIGLMNIRGSNGTSDIKSYATIGSGTRAYLSKGDIDFRTINEENDYIYLRRTGIKGKHINNLNINKLKNDNLKGEYGAFLGALGYEFKNNNLSLAVLGNADTDEQNHREICLIAMDDNGQIEKGNIDDLNIKDDLMPFGIKTDYKKLLGETKKYYKNSDLLIVELGDTYRLDLYKENLNKQTYNKLKQDINKNISGYLNEIFKMVNKEDRVYIISTYPKMQDYKNGYKLSYVILFEGDKKGLLSSATTRRKGIIGNVDIPVDILDYFGINSKLMVGKKIEKILENNNINLLIGDYEKTVSNSKIRVPVLYTYAALEMIVWILTVLALFFKNNIPKNSFKILSSFLKFTMTIPFALLIAPLFNFKSVLSIIACTVIVLISVYYLVHKFIKDDLNKLIALGLLVSIGVLIDGVSGQNMIKNSLLGYDPIIGARYYGIGNEYMGVLIGSLIFSLVGLLEKNKIAKKTILIILLISVVILGHPKMGANVGGTITAVFSFLYLILRLYDIKIDMKKIILICIAVVCVVASMAVIDIFFIGSKSHLAGAIQKIISGGPLVIIQIIKRKIEMNLRLIGVTIWSKVLISGILIVGVLFYKPIGIFKNICEEYSYLTKGWSAIVVGSTVGFFVNDSGVVAAATSIAYVIIPLLVIITKHVDKLRKV